MAALVNPAAGSKLAIAEALTNIVWAPLTHGLKGVSLSANWMWPAKKASEASDIEWLSDSYPDEWLSHKYDVARDS